MRSSWLLTACFIGTATTFDLPLPRTSVPQRQRRCSVSHSKICYAKPHSSFIQKSKSFNTRIVLRGGVSASLAVPALRVWIGPALVCALSYALYNVFIKKASSSIDPVLGGVLLQFVAAILGSVLYICKRFLSKSNATTIASQTPGIWWAVAAGAAVGAAEILSFIISGMGVQAMQSIPIIIGGSVLFGTILGKLWLQEALGIRGYVGVLLISAGIALVGMDPGTKLH